MVALWRPRQGLRNSGKARQFKAQVRLTHTLAGAGTDGVLTRAR
jgi:hypothetical protein